MLPAGVADVLAVLRSSAVVLDGEDRVVRASPAAYSFGLVRRTAWCPDDLLELARKVRRDGEIREAELELPRGPLGTSTHRGLRQGGAAGLGARAAAGRGPHRGSPGRRGPPRLRGQRQPRAQDPGGGAGAARRGAARRGGRPRGGAPVRRPHAARGATGCPGWCRTSSTCPGCRATTRCARRRWSSSTSVVAEAVDRCRLAGRGAARSSLVSGGAPRARGAWATPRQLVTALGNLVDNAVRYSPDGTRGSLSTCARSRTPGGRIAEISVTDQGPGIPEADLERIFERFYRVDAARSRHTGGTGLGLSIVKHVAANHGGEVTVWSVGARLDVHPAAAGRTRAPHHRRRARDPDPGRRGRGVLQRRPVLHAAQGGLRGRGWPAPARPPSRSSTGTAPTWCCST